VSDLPPLPPCPPNDDEAIGRLPSPPQGDRDSGPGAHWARELPTPPPLAPRPPEIEAESEDRQGWWSSEGRIESSAWLISFVVHAVTLFLLGLITLSARPGGTSLSLLASGGEDESGAADVDGQPLTVEPDSKNSQDAGSSKEYVTLDAASVDVPVETPRLTLPIEKPKKPENINNSRSTGAGNRAGAANGTPSSQAPTGGGWEGRNRAGRAAATGGGGGGTKQSEEAVERGLRWLVAHQRDDGSWCFDLQKPPCNGLCRNSGSEASTTAATGLALLPFLGAGYTQTQGEHQEAVKRGLYYLSTRAVITPHGVDLRDGGTMYSQGIATIALCEAYGMTHDAGLKEIAQGAIRFIVYAQDMQRGGWRYTPGTPGDTTVTGWQLMALKSGQMAKLQVPSPTIGLVTKFLDGVSYDRGARYGYLTPKMRTPTQETTTAVGLLCRMYTGWNRSRQALYRGVEHLHKWGFSKTNMYYDYYATQVLHHFQGPEWQAWNRPMRDYLVSTQSNESHEAGSWYFPDPYGDRGGRLYNTALAIMILEVSYRHMPLYGEEAVHGL
jgi:hypothetical protein